MSMGCGLRWVLLKSVSGNTIPSCILTQSPSVTHGGFLCAARSVIRRIQHLAPHHVFINPRRFMSCTYLVTNTRTFHSLTITPVQNLEIFADSMICGIRIQIMKLANRSCSTSCLPVALGQLANIPGEISTRDFGF